MYEKNAYLSTASSAAAVPVFRTSHCIISETLLFVESKLTLFKTLYEYGLLSGALVIDVTLCAGDD